MEVNCEHAAMGNASSSMSRLGNLFLRHVAVSWLPLLTYTSLYRQLTLCSHRVSKSCQRRSSLLFIRCSSIRQHKSRCTKNAQYSVFTAALGCVRFSPRARCVSPISRAESHSSRTWLNPSIDDLPALIPPGCCIPQD